MKKKILAGLMACVLSLSVAGCGTDAPAQSQPAGPVSIPDYTQAAQGEHGVVAAADPVAADVGLQILKKAGYIG